MKKQNIIPMLFILFSIFIIISSTTATVTTTGDIWQIINGNTIAQNNTNLNVNIGENTSTSYKLNVEGNTRLNGTLTVNYDSIFHNTNIIGYTALSFGGDISHLNSYLFENSGIFDIYSYCSLFNIKGEETLNIESGRTLDINSGSELYIDSVKDTFLKPSGGIIHIGGKIESNTTIQTSGVINGAQIQSQTDFTGWGILPIGGVISWCNHLGNVRLEIPDGYWICNGSKITDTDSIFYDENSPNMTNRFIRGANYSQINTVATGNTGGNNTHVLTIGQMPTHSHTLPTNILTGVTTTTVTATGLTSIIKTVTTDSNTRSQGNGKGFDNQPNYYDMVYLIRIK